MLRFLAVVLFSTTGLGKLLPAVLLFSGDGELPQRSHTPLPHIAPAQPQVQSQPPAASLPKTLQYSYPTFNSRQFDQQLHRYLQYLAAFGPPDVLIVGSSRALQGVDPTVLQQTLTRRNVVPVRVFNFGINGATAQVVDLLLRRILTSDQLPKLILWADGSRAFNSGRLDITFNGMMASQGYKSLAKGVRPALPPTAASPEICLKLPPEYVALNNSVAASANQLAIAASRYGFKTEKLCGSPEKFTHQLYPLQRLLPNSTAPASVNTGFRAVSDRFNPDTYYQRYPQVPGGFDADYQNFHLWGTQSTALQRLLAFTYTRKIPVVFVNLPLTESYLDAARTEYERQFQAYIRQFARQRLLILRDLSQHRQLSRNDYFADPSHINRFGAAAIATHLARDSGIPWSKLNQPGTSAGRE